MSYYMWVDNVEVCLQNHETYASKEHLAQKIRENEKRIEEIKGQLFGLCCGDIKSLLHTEDCEGEKFDPIDALERKFHELFDAEYEGLEYLIAHNVDLQYVHDNWDKKKEG